MTLERSYNEVPQMLNATVQNPGATLKLYDVRMVTYLGSTNIKCHCTKFRSNIKVL